MFIFQTLLFSTFAMQFNPAERIAHAEGSAMVRLTSSEGDVFEVSRAGAEMSKLVKDMIEDELTEEECPLPNVNTAALQKVVEYMNHYEGKEVAEIQKPLKSANLIECGINEYDANFIDIPQEELFTLILAANYLDVKPLLELACAKTASMIKGKNTEEIRKQFNIVNDFTPEEEAQVREENRWVQDA